MRLRLLSAVFVLAGLLIPGPAFSSEPAGSAAGTEQFRQELTGYFENLSDYSPTTLNHLSGDAAALEAVKRNIGELSSEELATMQEAFSEVPSWQLAPEALSAGLPQESLQQLTATARLSGQRVEDLEKLRGDLSAIYGMLRMLPGEQLQQFGLDIESVTEVHLQIPEMSASGLVQLEKQTQSVPGWQQLVSRFDSLPAGMLDGARRMAQPGAVESAVEFRAELLAFLADAERLPGDLKQRLVDGRLGELRHQLEFSTPEMLVVLQQQLDTPELRALMRDVRILAGAQSLNDEEREELQAFRSEFTEMIAGLAEDAQNSETVAEWREQLASADRGEVALLRDRIERIPSWRETMPAIVKANTSPEFVERRGALRAGTFTPDAEERLALEEFRTSLAEYFEAVAGEPDVDAVSARAAASRLRGADIGELYVISAAYGEIPEETGTQGLVDLIGAIGEMGGGAVMVPAIDLDCSIGLGSINLPLGIGTVSLGSIDLNFICDPIEDVLNVIEDVFAAVVELPTTIANFFEGLAASVLAAFSPENLQNALNMAGNFWNNIPEVPQIPCPPDGVNIPFFGEVGESETARKYSRYLWIFDKVLGIIPDTEISLSLKIPAQVLYGGVEYLGLCLETAANARTTAATNVYRADVGTQFNDVDSRIAALQALLGTQGAELTAQLAESRTFLMSLAIEKNLLDDSGDRVMLFQTPQSMGGVLEKVGEVVENALMVADAMGEGSSNAWNNYNSGVAAYDRGDYKQSFFYYRRAYQQAAD